MDRDDSGIFISIVNYEGIVIDNIEDYIVEDKYKTKIIDLMKEVKEDTFFSGWGEATTKLYLNEDIELLENLKKCDNLINNKLEKIIWEEKENPMILRIYENTEDTVTVKLIVDGKEDFIPILNNYILIDNIIYKVSQSMDSMVGLKELERNFNRDELERIITLAKNYDKNIEVDYLDYEILEINNFTSIKELIIEKIAQDNSLYLKVDISISTLSYEFLKSYGIESVYILKEDSKKIEKIDIQLSDLESAIDEITKLIMKHQKSLKLKSSIYIDNNFIILQEQLAKEFVTKDLLQLVGKYKIIGSDNLKKYNIKTVKPKVVGKFSYGIDFLEGEAYLDIEGEKFSIFEILDNLKRDSYIVLNDGTNALINKKYLDKLERVFKKGDDSKIKISFFDLPLVDDLIEDKILDENSCITKKFYLGINNITDYKVEKAKINAKLRNYQEYGYKWLSYLLDNNVGGCLADDMGLGKTLQAIAILSRIHSKKNKKSLIIMPKSLVYNWENEIKKFAPQLVSGIYYGNNRDKDIFKNSEVIITTYGTVRNDISILKDMKFELVILDESQNIKNVNAQTTKAVMLLNSVHRIALSGTPIENNLSELYSLFRFLNPNMFGSMESFNIQYAIPIQKENDRDAIEELKKKIYPFILRRIKKDVLKDLPEKIEKTLFIEMSSEQKKLYEERRAYYYNMINTHIKDEGLGKTQFYILQALNELRQITSCPDSKNKNIISSKREVLLNNVQDAVENGHKVLIFTNYIKSIEGITKDLKERGIKYLEMTGATKDRQGLVDLFQKDKRYKVFVMTLKTGGVGLNLTAADTIFIYDPWWNKTVENQAIDRAYRLGQDRTVFSYKLILKDTIEEKILKLQESKSQLLDNLISDDGLNLKSLDEKDIEFILGE